MYPFEKLIVWQRAHALAVAVLAEFAPNRDPRMRMLADQAWRAACPTSSNIAEGAASASNAQLARYLTLALGSAFELESHVRVAKDARLIESDLASSRIASAIEVKKMLWALRECVRGGSDDAEGKKKRRSH